MVTPPPTATNWPLMKLTPLKFCRLTGKFLTIRQVRPSVEVAIEPKPPFTATWRVPLEAKETQESELLLTESELPAVQVTPLSVERRKMPEEPAA